MRASKEENRGRNFNLEREASERFQLLNEEWDFGFYPNLEAVPTDFFVPEAAALPDRISVPGSWQHHGYDQHQYTNINYPFPFDPPHVPHNNPAGAYRHTFNYEKDPQAPGATLVFEGVDSCFYLWLNGKYVGYSQVAHAQSAFDVTDYLQKPITPERFDAAVKRAIAKYEQMHFPKEEEEHIFVKSNLKKRKVFLSEIKWVEALGDYIKLVTDDANIVVLSTMKAFEKELPSDRFLRIHKSYIINLDKVERFTSKTVEVKGMSIPLSRNKKSELSDALNNF